MITIRLSHERGIGGNGINWLDSKHSFSFADYQDPKHKGFSHLKVINEDRVAPSGGFATHPHTNMEIVSYVISGQLQHHDSMGNGSIIKAGDIQRMSAGSGVTHSEYNVSNSEPVHFLQIWFLPKQIDIEPSYEQNFFAPKDKQGQFKLVLSEYGQGDSLSINQDINMYVVELDNDDQTELPLKKERVQWIQMVKGQVKVNGHDLQAGDGAAVTEEAILNFKKAIGAEIIVFDMPPV